MRIQPHLAGRSIAVAITATILTGCAAIQGGGSTSPRADGRALHGTRYSLLPPTDSLANASTVPADRLFEGRAESIYQGDLQFEHPKVDAFVFDYETRSRGSFERALDRSAKYISRMEAILREEGLPAELAYLPLIESGFSTRAVSPAGAVGPWQFIPGTGRRYGLRIDRYVDERRDPEKSTRAAAHYLRDLFNMFGDWHLSLAAYNTGEYRVARTMDREGTDSYWDLMENRNLHPETCDYVPRFLAALTIVQSPAKHGFDTPEPEPISYDKVLVDRSVSLRAVAAMAGCSESEIADLNPALLRGITPPDSSGYPVHVPPGKKDQFEVAYASMLREARDAQAVPVEVAAGDRYRVRRGDTLAAIARRHGVSAQALLRANGLRNAKQLRAGGVLRIPGDGAPARVVASGKKVKAKTAPAAKSASSYKVKKGDTIAGVARRLGVPQKELLRANGLENGRSLKAGANLRVPVKAKPRAVRVAKRK